jgi:hypothetical protein
MSDMSITVIYPAMSLTVLYLANLECNKKIAHCCNSSKISLKIVDKEAHTHIYIYVGSFAWLGIDTSIKNGWVRNVIIIVPIHYNA